MTHDKRSCTSKFPFHTAVRTYPLLYDMLEVVFIYSSQKTFKRINAFEPMCTLPNLFSQSLLKINVPHILIITISIVNLSTQNLTTSSTVFQLHLHHRGLLYSFVDQTFHLVKPFHYNLSYMFLIPVTFSFI